MAAAEFGLKGRLKLHTMLTPGHTPYHQSVLHKVTPVYETFPGWNTEVGDARTLDELPSKARDFVRFVEEFAGVPFAYITVGRAREQIITPPA